MKKFILLLISVLILCSCTGGKNVRIPVQKGDVRCTVTNEHIIIETCDYVGNFGNPHWKLGRVISREDNKTPIEIGGMPDKLVK